MSWIKNLFNKTYSKQEEEFFSFLQQNKIFNLLSYSELEKIKPLLYLREYKENEVVFFRNDPSQAIYIVKKGKVTFSIDFPEGKEEMLTLEQGQIFGQNGIIEKSVRNYNAIVTSSNASIYVLPQQGILELFEKDEKLKSKVLSAFMTYYSNYVTEIFSTYRENLGFFEMNQVYKD